MEGKMGLDDFLNERPDEFKTLPERELMEDEIEEGAKGRKKKSQAEIVLDLVIDTLTLFHDKNKDAFAFVNGEVVALRSKAIRHLLSMVFYQATGKGLNNDSLGQVLNVLEAKAVYESQQVELWNRVAKHEGAFWYDLGRGKAVKITADGWAVVEVPILFRRYAHQQPQAEPIRGGDPRAMFRFLNVADQNKLLVVVYVISCFVPDIPHPIFHPHGAQGSGKTSLCNLVKKLIDPSSIEAIITPRDYNQLVQMITHHYICLFDNLSFLPAWMSDVLAMACTGGGFSKRQLYTDDDDIIYQVKRCIGLNGINLLISKADVMDRSILLTLERIDPTERIEEVDLWAGFEKERARILGGIFDTLSQAMAIHPSLRLSRLPRMADFARWGYAIAEALGKRGNEFLNAYQVNIERQNEEVVQGNTLAQAVLNFIADEEKWNGYVREAFEILRNIANPTKTDRTFPGDQKNLRKHLERIKTTLIEFGVRFEIGKRDKRGVPISFLKESETSTSSTSSPFDPESNKLEGASTGVDDVTPASSIPRSTPENQLNLLRNVDGAAGVDDFHTYKGKVVDLTNMDLEVIP